MTVETAVVLALLSLLAFEGTIFFVYKYVIKRHNDIVLLTEYAKNLDELAGKLKSEKKGLRRRYRRVKEKEVEMQLLYLISYLMADDLIEQNAKWEGMDDVLKFYEQKARVVAREINL